MSENSEHLSKVFRASSVHEADPVTPLDKLLPPLSPEKFIERALESYESMLIGYAFTILNDLDLARDVVQDTFIRLCQQDLGKVQDKLKSWLFTVCRNRALDVLRKGKRTHPLDETLSQNIPDPDLQPDEKLDQQELFSQLASYLDRLTSNQRDTIVLKFQQGLSYQEIQEITGLTATNIGFLIHGGLKRLREIMPKEL
jgi:RNA polymerase sigma factor (sigma-70 family)